MNLNDLKRFRELDSQHMAEQIDSLPDQLEAAWTLGKTLPLPDSFKSVQRLVIAGMGGAAISGDLLAALVEEACPIPILISRDYELPAYASSQDTLVIVISYAHEEEALSALDMAHAHGAQSLTITTSDALASRAQQLGATLWRFDYTGQSRSALGWSFGLLLALVQRLGLIKDIAEDVSESVENLRGRIPILGIDSLVVKNPAKRLAGQMVARVPVIYGAGILAPVARRWKTQLNENSKTWAIWEELPEMNHNAVSGITYPQRLRMAVVFLSSPQFDHPRIALRQDLTRELYLQQGIAPDTIKARGKSKLAHMLSAIQFGDYVSYYLAMAYEIDPTPTPSIEQLKEKLSLAQRS